MGNFLTLCRQMCGRFSDFPQRCGLEADPHNHIRPNIGDIPLDKLTAPAVFKPLQGVPNFPYKISLISKNLSQNKICANTLRSVLPALFRFLKRSIDFVSLSSVISPPTRLLSGTLKYNTFIATFQMVDRICDVALFLPDEEIKAMSWSDFAAGCQAPELIQYLRERRLYVNDMISAEEEI